MLTQCYAIRIVMSVGIIPIAKEFSYSSVTQGYVLSSFFFGYMMLQIPAGTLGAWYGGKRIFTLGILLPSTTVALIAHRGAEKWRAHRLVMAFREGTLPLTLGLLAAAGWILAAPTASAPAGLGLTLLSAVLVWRTRINPLWLIAAGALAGGLGAL
jgi:chromate transporter